MLATISAKTEQLAVVGRRWFVVHCCLQRDCRSLPLRRPSCGGVPIYPSFGSAEAASVDFTEATKCGMLSSVEVSSRRSLRNYSCDFGR